MIWDHIKTQVDSRILNSPYQLFEFKEILADDDWYKIEPFNKWQWWIGYKKEMSDLTFSQIRGFWACEDEKRADERMEYLHYHLCRTVDELIRIDAEEGQQDLVVELNKAIEEEAA